MHGAKRGGCTGVVQGYPLLPVYAGEMSGRCLAVDAAAYDADGHEVVGELGELVIRKPMPSMSARFWNDPDGARHHAAYFDRYPGVWRFGDWIIDVSRRRLIVTPTLCPAATRRPRKRCGELCNKQADVGGGPKGGSAASDFQATASMVFAK